jgi:GxxExxY protein
LAQERGESGVGHKADDFVKPEYHLSHVTARVIAAAREVHRGLGPGFREVLYQRALTHELPAHGLRFEREVWVDVMYKGAKLGAGRVDFVVREPGATEIVMLEVKARPTLNPAHFAQALSYLKASGCRVGLLINFGAPKLQVKRLAN